MTARCLALAVALLGAALPALAQDPVELQPATETSRFVISTLVLLAASAAGVLAVAGLAAREAGFVQAKNAGAAGLKAIAIASVCALVAWAVGYGLIYSVEPGGFLGDFRIWTPDDVDPSIRGRGSAAHWLFMVSACAISAIIYAGALAERIRLWPLILFTGAFAALVFPVAAGWSWGGGYLAAAWRFSDFAGATLIHSVGGWAALAGAVIVGPRLARYGETGPLPWPPGNPAMAALGALLVWIGAVGFSFGAHGAVNSANDAIALARIGANSTISAAAGVVVAAFLTTVIYRKIELPIVVNGAIGGLAAIAAGPVAPELWQAIVIGAFSGAIVTVTGPLLDRFHIDDPVGAIPAHLLCGVWGSLIVPWCDEKATYLGQVAGIVIVGAYALTMSILIWTLLRYTIGARAAAELELSGADAAELGLEAAPRFPSLDMLRPRR
jgi:Amt family ammonium transporter